jgi:hypothetical protein
LKWLRSLARATYEGLRDDLDHARSEHEKQALRFAIEVRDKGVELGADGHAYFVRSERQEQLGPGGRKVVAYVPVRSLADRYDPLAAQVHRAKAKLDDIRAQKSSAAVRSSKLNRAVQKAEELLRGLGWTAEV